MPLRGERNEVTHKLIDLYAYNQVTRGFADNKTLIFLCIYYLQYHQYCRILRKKFAVHFGIVNKMPFPPTKIPSFAIFKFSEYIFTYIFNKLGVIKLFLNII